uniref:Uncharacterized protein n=1 Tax=Timema poppense TaxID=170557 RepID=A0A7R9CP33_TIMPO|nr:unnamed protein product [Timema poppensis]
MLTPRLTHYPFGLYTITHTLALLVGGYVPKPPMRCNCPVSQPGPTLASTCGGSAFMLFMGLLEVFIRSQCDLEDPCGRPESRR